MDDDIDVTAVRFRTTRMADGYDMAEVDAFLDRVGAVFASRDPAPPGLADEVASATFRVIRFGVGYDMGDVDDFLDHVVLALHSRAAADGPTAPAEPVWNGAVANSARELTYTADRPAGARFDRVGRLSAGYAVAPVDAFVEQTSAQISRPPPDLRAHQTEAVTFARERRGYDYAAVDDWVARVAAHLRERGLP